MLDLKTGIDTPGFSDLLSLAINSCDQLAVFNHAVCKYLMVISDLVKVCKVLIYSPAMSGVMLESRDRRVVRVNVKGENNRKTAEFCLQPRFQRDSSIILLAASFGHTDLVVLANLALVVGGDNLLRMES